MEKNNREFSIEIDVSRLSEYGNKYLGYLTRILIFALFGISVYYYVKFLNNGLGLAYNDARSHLDIGRRVVEGLKPGMAQLGSVWLPLNHMLMIPLIWNDWAWHTGFAGSLWSMLSFVGTGLVIYRYLKLLGVGAWGRLVGVLAFIANINILYLQSTAMTELLLLYTMTAGCYYLLKWHQKEELIDLIKSAFWIMMATLVRYDGWFLLGFSSLLVVINIWKKYGTKLNWRNGLRRAEGFTVLFLTLSGIGILGWFLWNLLIFGDPLYFMLGPYSAHAQQEVLASAGDLPTKGNLLLSIRVYLYALMYSSYTFPAILAFLGLIMFRFDRKLNYASKLAGIALLAPMFFNIIALYLGFSVIFVQGITGNSWFNVRYGVMLIPTLAIFIGFLFDRAKSFKPLVIGSLLFVLFFAFYNQDSTSVDDARYGASQKNVNEVSGYIRSHATEEPGFILISAASHDAIIFSSGLPMKRFIHEGTGKYWDNAISHPEEWARWIIMRTYDEADMTWKNISINESFSKYEKVTSYPFADVYQLKPEFHNQLHIQP